MYVVGQIYFRWMSSRVLANSSKFGCALYYFIMFITAFCYFSEFSKKIFVHVSVCEL